MLRLVSCRRQHSIGAWLHKATWNMWPPVWPIFRIQKFLLPQNNVFPLLGRALLGRLVCFITKSFLTYSFFHLRLLYQPYLGLCQASCVQSHQRQPMSAGAITACEVQVSAADSQTVPTVVTGVSKPLCCRFTLTFTLTSENLSLCTTLLRLLSLVLIQLCSPRCWHLDSNYCRTRCRQSQLRFVLPLLLHPRLLETFQSDIPLFTLTWPAKHIPNQGWESTHRLHLYPLGGVFYSP